jgi:hypothetical protein
MELFYLNQIFSFFLVISTYFLFIFLYFIFSLVTAPNNGNLFFPSANTASQHEYFEQNKKSTQTWVRTQAQNWRDHFPGLRRETETIREARGYVYLYDTSAERSDQKGETFALQQTVRIEKSGEKAREIRSVRERSKTPSAGGGRPQTREPDPALLYSKYRRSSPDGRVPHTREPGFAAKLLFSHRKHMRYSEKTKSIELHRVSKRK